MAQRPALVHDLLERATALFVLVRVGGARSVEAPGSLSPLDLRHLVGLDEQDLGFRIDETADQPRRRGPIDVNSPACDPLHCSLLPSTMAL
jgi:hypothetical protein